MSSLFGESQKPAEISHVKMNQSKQGMPVPVVYGVDVVAQNVVWVDGFIANKVSGTKGKEGGSEYLYTAGVIAALCNGPALALGDVWSSNSWMGLPLQNESITIPTGSDPTYTPVYTPVAPIIIGIARAYSNTYSDAGAPSSTVLSGTDYVPMEQVAYGTALVSGQYSIDGSGVIHYSSADSGQTAYHTYTHNTITQTRSEIDLVPSGKTITVGASGSGTGSWTPFPNTSNAAPFDPPPTIVTYASGANEGQQLTQVSGTPSATGTFQVVNNSPSTGFATYHFASGDVNAEVEIVYAVNDATSIPAGASATLTYEFYEGTQGQAEDSTMSSNYPQAALGYSNTAYNIFKPMQLYTSGTIQENRFEVVSPILVGGTNYDANPVQCIQDILTNTVYGLGAGPTPFPAGILDTAGTWGSPAYGARTYNSTAWNWFAANSFFISHAIDQQDSAASLIGKYLEAGMCAAFFSEGLLKLVPYGDTSTAGNGCTWVAPQDYVVALDDTCFIAKDGADPVQIEIADPADAFNTVQVQWKNRENQYGSEITQEWDTAAINRYGNRIEDPQDYDFIKSLIVAQFTASMRVKRSVYIRNKYKFTVPYSYEYLEPMDCALISTTSSWAAGANNGLGILNLPVRITKIVDDSEKGLQIEAEDYPWGTHQPTIFNKSVSSADVVVNQFADPGQAEVVMFEATNRLTQYQGRQIWIGVCGTSANYGGTNVWASADGGNTYAQIGTIKTVARLGELASTFASGSDPDTVNLCVVDMAENAAALDSGTSTDADNLVLMAYVDGEVISYSAASVTGQNQYTLGTYIRRGQMGTSISSHSAGGVFLRLDDTIWTYTYDPSWIGKTIYFKFQAFNTFNNQAQPLSSLTATSFTITGSATGTVDAASGLVIPAGQASNNPVIQNANFEMTELPVPGWEAISGTTTVSDGASGLTQAYETSSPASGNQSLKLTASSAYCGLQSNTIIAVNPGDVWKLSGSINNYSTGASIADLCLYFMDKTGTRTGFLPLTNSTNDSNWHSVSSTITVPANSVYAFVYCRVDGAGTAGFDNIQLVRVSSLDDEVADGSSFVKLLASHAVNNVAYNFKGIWSSSTAYVQGDEVVYGQSYWVALAGSTNSAPSTGNANWQVVGSYSGYQGAWSSSTAYVAGAEVTYSGNYWVCVTGNTNSAPTTSNSNWQIAGPSNLDNIADGSTYARTPLTVAAEGLINNGTFASGTAGWQPYLSNTTINVIAGGAGTPYTGNYLQIHANTATGGAYYNVQVPHVAAGQVYSFSAYMYGQSSDPCEMMVLCYNAAGTLLSANVLATVSSGSWTYVTEQFTIPSNCSYIWYGFRNPNTPSTYIGVANVQAVLVRSLDTQVSDGSTYGRTLQAGLSSGYASKTGGGSYTIKGVGDSSTLSLDSEIADGSVYLRSAQMTGTPENIPNANFEASSSLPVPGWTPTTGASFSYETSSPQSGSRSLKIAYGSGGAGSGYSTASFAVSPGDVYFVSGYVKGDGTYAPAIGLKVTLQSGSVSWQLIYGTSSTSWQAVSGQITIPANAVSAQVGLNSNTSATCTQWYDNIKLSRIRSLDNEVSDGSTYIRPSNVNSNHLLGTKGLVPIDAAGTTTASSSILTQSGTGLTIDVAAFTIQYGFGQVNYNSGSVTVGSYGTYLIYFSDPTYSGGSVTYVATTNGYSAFAGEGYIIVGSVKITSAGGGSGGIGGGGTQPCFSPNTRVLTDDGIVPFSELAVGQRSKTAAGTWCEIKTVTRNPYRGPMFDMGDGELVTPNHLFKIGDRWIPACEMGFPRVDHWQGYVMNTVMDAPGEESLDAETEHSYTLGNGHCVHNQNQLPC